MVDPVEQDQVVIDLHENLFEKNRPNRYITEEDQKKTLMEWLVCMDFDFFEKFEIDVKIKRHAEFRHICVIDITVKSIVLEGFEATVKSQPILYTEAYCLSTAKKAFELAQYVEDRVKQITEKKPTIFEYMMKILFFLKST